MPENNTINQVEATAHWTAQVRAFENQRSDRLFADPFALSLAGVEGEGWMKTLSPERVIPIIIRTRYFDDFLVQKTTEHEIPQVVLLAAGLDTRAFRLNWPEKTTFFEVDLPNIFAYKNKVLESIGAKPLCKRLTIDADLTGQWQSALLQAGYDPLKASIWLMEGILFYLPNEQITHIIDVLTKFVAPESWIGFDIVNSITFTHPLTKAWIEMQAKSGAPWIGSLENPIEFLSERHWKATVTQAGQPDANYGRWSFPVLPVDMPGVPHNWYVTAQKN